MKNRKVKITIGDMEYSAAWGDSPPEMIGSEVSLKISGIPNVDKVNVVELNGVKFVREGGE